MTDFFTKPEPTQPMPPEPTTVKVGEKEYSQDELNNLVNLGETAREYEKQWNRPIKDFYPDYTRKSQQLAEFERSQEAQKQQELQTRAQQNQLTPEEARQVALQQAKELGIMTQDTFQDAVNQAVDNRIAAQELIHDSQSLVAEQSKKGLPNVELSNLLSYMNGENPTGTRFGTPEKAYNDMFEKEIGSWRDQQLSSIKPQGMVTNSLPQAGNSQAPAPQSINTKEALTQAIRDSLARSNGGV